MTQYADGLAASAALASAMAARGLANEDGRLIGDDAVQNEALANLLNGEIASGAELSAGAGALGVGGFYESSVTRNGSEIVTVIDIDLTGLAGTATDLDIIGLAAGGAANIGQITDAVNGVIYGGTVECLEAPVGGVTDIDVYAATVGTGAFDVGIATLVETVVVTSGAAWTLGRVLGTAADGVAANAYLYMTCGEAAAGGTFTAGRFRITLYGRVA